MTKSPKAHNTAKVRPGAVMIVRLCIVLVSAAAFALYSVEKAGKFQFWNFILPFATLALFDVCAWLAVPKLINLIGGNDEFEAVGVKPVVSPVRRFIVICVFSLLLHAALFILGVWLYGAVKGYEGNLLKYWRIAWMKQNTDAGHYLTIAKNWYVTSGNDQLLLVFFPLYPMLIRALDIIVQDGFVSAQIINAAAVSLMSGTVYLTLRQWLGDRRAAAGAFIALLLPGAVFLNSPMTEPLFMLFCSAAFLFIQKKRYIAAGIFTCLAGMTRSLGVLMCVPLFIVGICDVINAIRRKEKYAASLLKLGAGLLIGICGTLYYLYLNYSLFGDPLKFLEFQASNWNQEACPFFDTPRYALDNLIAAFKNNGSIHVAYSLWIPNFIAIFGSLALMCAVHKDMPFSYTAFFLCYFAAAIGCTWLLSATRYICAAVPVTAALALLCKKRTGTVIMFTALSVAYITYLLMYMLRWSIY